ncbi:MAG: hypothetical protein ACK4MF_02985 [Hyphomicrobiaceae bacterium]
MASIISNGNSKSRGAATAVPAQNDNDATKIARSVPVASLFPAWPIVPPAVFFLASTTRSRVASTDLIATSSAAGAQRAAATFGACLYDAGDQPVP